MTDYWLPSDLSHAQLEERRLCFQTSENLRFSDARVPVTILPEIERRNATSEVCD